MGPAGHLGAARGYRGAWPEAHLHGPLQPLPAGPDSGQEWGKPPRPSGIEAQCFPPLLQPTLWGRATSLSPGPCPWVSRVRVSTLGLPGARHGRGMALLHPQAPEVRPRPPSARRLCPAVPARGQACALVGMSSLCLKGAQAGIPERPGQGPSCSLQTLSPEPQTTSPSPSRTRDSPHPASSTRSQVSTCTRAHFTPVTHPHACTHSGLALEDPWGDPVGPDPELGLMTSPCGHQMVPTLQHPWAAQWPFPTLTTLTRSDIHSLPPLGHPRPSLAG